MYWELSRLTNDISELGHLHLGLKTQSRQCLRKKNTKGAGEKTHQLTALAVLPENLGSILDAHSMTQPINNSSCRESDAPFWPS